MTRYAVAILLALTMPASAQDIDSANYILPGCKGFVDRKSPPTLSEAMWQGRCAGFIEGLWIGIGGKDLCPPSRVTASQSVAVVVKYIEARPERMHEPFSVLAVEALTAAWPCKH
jgi:Rap1a immunity proteins